PEPTRQSASTLPPPKTATSTAIPTTPTHTLTATATATITNTPGPTSLPSEYSDSYWAIQISDALSPGPSSGFEILGQTSDGGFIAVGDPYVPYVEHYGQVIKLRESGEVAWRYAMSGDQRNMVRIRDYLPTADGGALLSGRISPPIDSGSSESVSTLLRLDPEGGLLWERSYSGRPIQETDDGGFLLLGPGSSLLKLDRAGNVLWAKTIDLTTPLGPAQPEFARELPDGGLLVGGFEVTFAPFRPRNNSIGRAEYPTRLWFTGISADDEVLWTRYFEFRGFAGAMPTEDGGMAIAGGNYIGDTDYVWLLKIGPEGDIAFWKRYRELSFVWGTQKGSDDGFVLVGTGPVTEGDFGFADHRVLKVNSDGIAEWVLDFGSELEPDFAAPTQDGGVVLLFPGGWFYRFGADGSLPQCEATLHKQLDVRTTDVVLPPDQAALINGPEIWQAASPTEIPSDDRPAIRFDPLPWEIREVCRYFP
ncbi:MAG: hypothetical protein ACE5JF_11935, partial [Anaerolineales bacterium]